MNFSKTAESADLKNLAEELKQSTNKDQTADVKIPLNQTIFGKGNNINNKLSIASISSPVAEEESDLNFDNRYMCQ